MMKHTLAALTLAAFSAAASAQGYGVVSAGMSKHDVDCEGTTSCDKSGTAYKLVGGYKFTPNVAAELGYFDYGKSTLKDGPDSLEVKVSGWGVGAALHGDLSPNWTGVARVGLGQMKTKLTGAGPTIGSFSDSDNNSALYAGLGIGYRVAKNVTVDASWDFSQGKYDKNGLDESDNVHAFSLGLTFSF